MKLLWQSVLIVLLACSVWAQSQFDAIVDSANRIYFEGRFADAVVEISKLVELDPENPRTYLIRARFQKAAKDEAAFYKDLDKAIELGAKDLTTTISVSRHLFQTGKESDCKKVEKLISPHIALDSQNAEILAIRGQAKSCSGDLVGAFNDISAASNLNPKNPNYPLSIANLLSRLGDPKQALAVYGSYIRTLEERLASLKEPSERDELRVRIASLYQSRSNVHEKNGNQDLMIADLTKAVDMIENPATIHARSIAYAKYRMYAEAIADLTREIKIRSDNFDKEDSPPATPLPPLLRKSTLEHLSRLLAQRGDLNFLSEKFTDAISDYENAIRLDPNTAEKLAIKISNAKQRHR